MASSAYKDILSQLEALRLIDPHTHINPLQPASRTLADILGYHYYTELAHSAGMPREQIEQPGLDPKEKLPGSSPGLPPSKTPHNTAGCWKCARFFNFQDERITPDNWEALYDLSATRMAAPGWEQHVLDVSGLDQVYLTNDFDDPLKGFNTQFYVPCLRTDDLVFHLARPAVQQRFAAATGLVPASATALRDGIALLFTHFLQNNCRGLPISLPPDFSPCFINDSIADSLLAAAANGQSLDPHHAAQLSSFVFMTLADFCSQHKLPFNLMIGVNRRVYENGVYQGQDLFDSRVSLIQYKTLFNAFPRVTFPVSVLAETSNQELVSYSWIFPNVVTSGHWWYSNIPVYIERDTRGRLQAVPASKQIGYYSDMYKLEFALPKFAMYRRILAKVLALDFVADKGWSVDRAVSLGQQILRGNVEHIFNRAN
ncbi:MAG UNVERIFIED_CONTAM: amidohydrolase [Planctomycetaceae bacterium]|jgi:glucuronate isomerase